jgi:hypothetical protein
MSTRKFVILSDYQNAAHSNHVVGSKSVIAFSWLCTLLQQAEWPNYRVLLNSVRASYGFFLHVLEDKFSRETFCREWSFGLLHFQFPINKRISVLKRQQFFRTSYRKREFRGRNVLPRFSKQQQWKTKNKATFGPHLLIFTKFKSWLPVTLCENKTEIYLHSV